ncbi:MAG: zinc ribbon domain-containing protein [Candidatus Bathyarchaeia archaeon]
MLILKTPPKPCPLCSGSMASYGGRIMRCEKCGLAMDRDIVAVLNPQMRGAGLPKEPPMS